MHNPDSEDSLTPIVAPLPAHGARQHPEITSSSWREAGNISRPALIYLKFISLAAAALSTAVFIQLFFVMRRFEWHFLIVPVILALTIGLLLGRVMVLRERLRHQSGLFRAVADFAQEFTYFRRVDGAYEYVSPACRKITGYTADEFYATPNLMDRLVHPDDRERWQHHVQQINNAGLPVTLDLRLVSRRGETVWVNHVCGPVYDSNGAQIGVRATNLDITQRKAFEGRIEQMAYYDALTNLPNRHALARELQARVFSASLVQGKLAVLFLDLDRFKQLNDSFGHALGDSLLKQVGERLRACCENDTLIARVGGDEFVVVVPRIAEPGDAVAIARRLLDAVERPLHIEGRELYISGSIGIALYPYNGREPDELIRNADAAMYRSKKELKGNVRLFTPELVRHAEAFISMESRLRKAVRENEFTVYYQPIVRLSSGRFIGLEALARWQHPEKGLVLPQEFIPLAEEIGLIRALGEQIFAQVCRQLHQWGRQGIELPVSVNVSARQFDDPDFCQKVEEALRQAGCEAGLLEIEITEHALLGDLDAAVRKLEYLNQLGISISLDDFGTGYSSLGYLKRLPISKIKIDRSLVSDIGRHPRDQAILRAVLTLCRELDLELVTEGIETEEQKKLLQALGCNVCQGFLFCEPLALEKIEPMLREQKAACGRR